MLDVETRRRIDTARDILVGKVPDPKSQVEQITIALIYKFMWDIEARGEELGGQRSFFVNDFERYAWPKLLRSGLGGFETLNLYAEALDRIPENPGLPPLFRNIFNNAYLPYRDPETLREFLKVIDQFQYDHSERLGDAFEYLLSIMGAQGDAGQFRTPRHIIDFIVEIVNPQLGETVLDPACGTAGFLISAYKHIQRANTDADGQSTLTPHERSRLAESFTGYDISPDMVRLSLVNMYLHGFVQPDIHEYDTLTSDERWNEHFDVILANPPFMSPRGGIRPHNRFAVQSSRSEVLFAGYIAEHLAHGGRAGLIVPEGIVFQSQKAHTSLRKALIEQNLLVAVVSLPAGLFQPYSGVKTSILMLSRDPSRPLSQVAFFKVENDGYDLGAQRRTIDSNDLPQTTRALKEYLSIPTHIVGSNYEQPAPFLSALLDQGAALIVDKSRIADTDDYSLSMERYRDTSQRSGKNPIVPLGEICRLVRGVTYRRGDEVSSGGHGILRANNIVVEASSLDLSEVKRISGAVNLPQDKMLRKFDIFICLASGSKDHIGKVAYIAEDMDYYFGGFMGVVRSYPDVVDPHYLFYQLRDRRFNDFLRSQISGVNINNLSAKLLYRFAVPLPPLDEQREIMREISEYGALIDGARAVIAAYNPRVPIDRRWPLVSIGDRDVFRVEGGGTPRSNVAEYWNGSVPWATLVDIPVGNTVSDITSTRRTITDLGLQESSAKLMPVGSVIVSSRATIGRIAINRVPLATNQGFKNVIIEDHNRALPEFVALALKRLVPTMVAWASGGTFRELSKSRFSDLEIPLPDIDVQRAIVDEVLMEQAYVRGNYELVQHFQAKVSDIVSRVWEDQ